jgi:hypothetical protein
VVWWHAVWEVVAEFGKVAGIEHVPASGSALEHAAGFVIAKGRMEWEVVREPSALGLELG